MQTRLQTFCHLIHPVIGRMKLAAEHAVTARAIFLDAADDAVEGHAGQQQRLRSQHHAAFQHFGHHLGRTCLLEGFHMAVVGGAHHHRQAGPCRFYVVQYFHRGMRIIVGDRQHLGAHQPRRHQHFTLAGIAVHH